MRKFTDEDLVWATCDEPVGDRAAIRAALLDAQEKGLYEFAVLTHRYFLMYENAIMYASFNRSGFAVSRESIAGILAKMGRVPPKEIYEVAPLVREAKQ